MKRSLIPVLAAFAVLGTVGTVRAQTTVTQRVIPNPAGKTPTPPQAHLPVPDAIAKQPAAVLPANPAEMRRRIAAAVDEILALYGNPPFAEVIINDKVRGDALRRQLAMVGQADTLRTEIERLTATRDDLTAQVAAKERELAYFRDQAATLQQTLAASLTRLAELPPAGPIPTPAQQTPAAGVQGGTASQPTTAASK